MQLSGKTIVDVSSLLRSGARVSPTQLSGKTIVDISSHSQGSNFFDLSFQEETIVDRSLRVLYLGKYVNYMPIQPECGELLAALFFILTTSGLCSQRGFVRSGTQQKVKELSPLRKWE